MSSGRGDRFEVQRVPHERLPQIEMMPILAHRNPMHGLLEADVTHVRQQIRDAGRRSGTQLSFTAFLVGCLARAISESPHVQAFRKGRKLFVPDDVDVATLIEVDTDRAPVPVVHVVRGAARKSVEDIHDEIRTVQADRGSLSGLRRQMRPLRWTPRVLRLLLWRLLARSPRVRKRYGGTAVVTSVGMFGSGPGWGITLAGHPVHLTVGGLSTRPVLVDGGLESREHLCLTLTLDHEVVDGGPAVRFGARLRELIEQGYGLPQAPVTPASARSRSG